MKKILVILGFSAFVYACGGGDKPATEEKKDTGTTAAPAPASTSATDAGLEMIGALDCTTCHKINEKNIGPAYIDVSKKYEATPAVIDTLASKIIKGGVGVWGNVAMTAHPMVSMDSARTMVKYILNLKNSQ